MKGMVVHRRAGLRWCAEPYSRQPRQRLPRRGSRQRSATILVDFFFKRCGAYGLAHVTMAHAGRTSPQGEIVLTSVNNRALKVRGRRAGAEPSFQLPQVRLVGDRYASFRRLQRTRRTE